MKKIFRFVMVAPLMASLLILQNCGPKGDGCEDHDPVNTYYHISEADKSKIPFTGTDTLVYISTDGDTATLYGQGRKEFTEKVAEKWGRDPGCSNYDYNYSENIEFTYKGNNPDLNYIFIDFNAGVYSPSQSNADVYIGPISYHTYFVVLNHPNSYTDTVNIGSITYFGFNVHGKEMDLPYLYNSGYGFLRINTPNKKWLKKI